jgi:predicted amidophosphoribosyltransferase
MSHAPLACPLCGNHVITMGPCEVCVPRLTKEEKKTWEELQKLSEDDLFAIIGSYEGPDPFKKN